MIVAGFAGLRMGEPLALRWRHINFQAQRVHVQRSYSAGQESSPKSRKGRTVPLADQPAQELARIGQRPMFTAPNDLVFCSRIGTHLDGSALRRHYKRARDIVRSQAQDMPALRFHDLRHTFGTLAASSFDLVNIQASSGTPTPARRRGTFMRGRPRRMPRSSAQSLARRRRRSSTQRRPPRAGAGRALVAADAWCSPRANLAREDFRDHARGFSPWPVADSLRNSNFSQLLNVQFFRRDLGTWTMSRPGPQSTTPRP